MLIIRLLGAQAVPDGATGRSRGGSSRTLVGVGDHAGRSEFASGSPLDPGQDGEALATCLLPAFRQTPPRMSHVLEKQ
jgi:hypothetical protein